MYLREDVSGMWGCHSKLTLKGGFHAEVSHDCTRLFRSHRRHSTDEGAAQGTTPASIPLTVNGARNTATEQFPRINQDDAFKLYQEEKAVFVDVRAELGPTSGATSRER